MCNCELSSIFLISSCLPSLQEAAKAVAAVQQPGSSGISSKAASSLHSLHKVGHGLKLHPGIAILALAFNFFELIKIAY